MQLIHSTVGHTTDVISVSLWTLVVLPVITTTTGEGGVGGGVGAGAGGEEGGGVTLGAEAG